ncbi:hypothetical protein ACFL0D_08045 [Thermoproteota archaeon]
MFKKIESAIIEVLKGQLKNVPKGNIGTKKSKLVGKLPAVSIVNVSFDVTDVGVGSSMGGESVKVQEKFSSDGEKKEFILSEKPARSQIVVENASGSRYNASDYTVDYSRGAVIFTSPPKKGEDNISVKYLKPFEVKGLRLNLIYHIYVWASDEDQRDEIAVEVLEAILRDETSLDQQGVNMKLVKGFNASIDNEAEDVFGKTLEYMIEADLIVEIPYPRMERIDIKKL